MKAWIEAVLMGAMLTLWLHVAAFAHDATRVTPVMPAAAAASAPDKKRAPPPSRAAPAASQPASGQDAQRCACVSRSLQDITVLPRKARA
jgi:hypothetical protein